MATTGDRYSKGTQDSFPSFWGKTDGSLTDSGLPGNLGGDGVHAEVSFNVPILILVGVILFLIW